MKYKGHVVDIKGNRQGNEHHVNNKWKVSVYKDCVCECM